MKMYSLLFLIAFLTTGLGDKQLSSVTPEKGETVAQDYLNSVQIACDQRIRLIQYDLEPDCKVTEWRQDCWSGGFDNPCYEGIVLYIECDNQDPETIGDFTIVTTCKEPA